VADRPLGQTGVQRRAEGNAMSRVDVIVPCYKYGHFLRDCVGSVLTQGGVDVRVLIIDDASPDDSAAVGAALAAEDERVEFRRHAVNRGHIATYNEGLEWASGDYLVLLSADDLITPGALQRAVRLMEDHPEVALTYGPWQALHFEGSRADLPPADDRPGWALVSGPDFLRSTCATAENPIATSAAVVVRTGIQKRVGGYESELTHAGDLEMWMRFAVCGSIGVLNACQGIYRKHRCNMSHGYYRHPQADLRQRLEAIRCFFGKWGTGIAGRDELEEMASRALGGDAFWSACGAFDRGDARDMRECLDLAEELLPEVRGWPAYRNLRLKRLVGPRLWKGIRWIVRGLRRKSPVKAEEPLKTYLAGSTVSQS
jgi:glycosyltransferase involved in cell wall biosynthesis